MAKKTKKEKILAEYHRTYSYKPSQPPPAIITSEPHSDYSYILSDLSRIAILTGLAICAQLVLWYKLGH